MFSSASLPAFAQAGGLTGTIRGIVQTNTGAPVAGANVSVVAPSGKFQTTSDGGGHFTLFGLPIDTYTVVISVAGYAPFSQPGVTVTGGSTQDVGGLRLTSASLKVIGSTQSRGISSAFQPNQTVPQFTVGGTVLEAAQGKQASANEQNAILAVPGFQQDYLGNIVLEGSTTDQVHYQFDGVDFTDPAFTGSINNQFFNGIGSIQAIPGAGDPSQGNSGAGVVNLVVKRGTYPGTGLLDYELNQRPFGSQFNFQYGTATKDNRFSEFFSEFSVRGDLQYGPFGSQAIDNGSVNGESSYQENDFVNNFIYRFGKNNAQSLQFLYLGHAQYEYGNYGGLTGRYYDTSFNNPSDYCTIAAYSGIPAGGPCDGGPNYLQQVGNLEFGQTFQNQQMGNLLSTQNSNLLKFEYDNQLNATTYLNLRFFHAESFGLSNGFQGSYGEGDPFGEGEQTTGGSRTGATFQIAKQIGSANTVTLSGLYEFNRPNFGSVNAAVGDITIGQNYIDFLHPANPYAPISATNPCPVAGGCYLQNYFYTVGGAPAIPTLDLESNEQPKQYGLGLRDQITVSPKLNLDLGLRYDFLNAGFGNTLYYADENTQPVPGDPNSFYVHDFGFAENAHFAEPRFGISYKISSRDSISGTYGESVSAPGSGELASPEGNSAFAAFAVSPVTGMPIPQNPNFLAGANILGNPQAGVAGGTFVDYHGNLGTPGAYCFPTIPFPVGATATTQPSYSGSYANGTLQLGKPCDNYASQLYFAEDGYFPEVAAVEPPVFNNFDITYSHLFKDGSALKFNPFARTARNTQVIAAPLIFNAVTQSYTVGSLIGQATGRSYTSGVNLEYTLPDRKVGFTGFVSLGYINELTNTPPNSDSTNSQDFEPILTPEASAVSQSALYHAGFISPVTLTAGAVYKTKTGFRFNPVVHANSGYPYNEGLQTPFIFTTSQAPGFVPNTNLTDQFSAGSAPQYIDPSNPGSIENPIIAATRGVAESNAAGTKYSRPTATADFTIEYTKPGSRVTYGAQVLDIFNNAIYLRPQPNANWYPVTSGVGAPFSGQSASGIYVPGILPFVEQASDPYQPYIVPTFVGGNTNALALPTTVHVYVQYSL